MKTPLIRKLSFTHLNHLWIVLKYFAYSIVFCFPFSDYYRDAGETIASFRSWHSTDIDNHAIVCICTATEAIVTAIDPNWKWSVLISREFESKVKRAHCLRLVWSSTRKMANEMRIDENESIWLSKSKCLIMVNIFASTKLNCVISLSYAIFCPIIMTHLNCHWYFNRSFYWSMLNFC